MTNPCYNMRISGEDFNSSIVCLGIQLEQILNIVNNEHPKLIWYACDIDTDFGPNHTLGFEGYTLKEVGSISSLIKIIDKDCQFFSGVFFAFSDFQSEILSQQFSTEDPEFRDIGNALIEIRAFDTSYFEVYSSNFNFIKSLAKVFQNAERNQKF